MYTGGVSEAAATPRRIVRSLRAPPTCVTELVQLEGSVTNNKAFNALHDNRIFNEESGEVRSEMGSTIVDDFRDNSVSSSMFDIRRAGRIVQASNAHGGKGGRRGRGSNGKKTASRNSESDSLGFGSRSGGGPPPLSAGRLRRRNSSSGTVGGGNKNSISTNLGQSGNSLFNYSDAPSFYSYDDSFDTDVSEEEGGDGEDAGSADTSASYSTSTYNGCEESVPSCSLSLVPDEKTVKLMGRARRSGGGARHSSAAARGGGDSFGSLFDGVSADQQNPVSSTSLTTTTGGQASTSGVLGSPPPPPAATAAPAAPLTTVDVPPTWSAKEGGGGGGSGGGKSGKTRGNGNSPVVSVTSPKHLDATRAGHGGTDSCDDGEDAGTDKTNGGANNNNSNTSGNNNNNNDSSSTANGEEGWRVTEARKEDRIGRGSYGDVYRGVDLATGRTIAIKEILVSKDFTKDVERQIATLEREIRVMRKLNHPNTVNYLGARRGDGCLDIFMEYVGGGSVGQRLRADGAFDEATSRAYTRQLLAGLEYLHARRIVHRDLKGDNLFLTEDNVLKVGDFGTSKELVTTLVTDSVAGTPNFMAPEVIACSGHSYEADIWSVGCCVLEMLTGAPPFAKLDNQMAVMFAIMKGKLEEQVPAAISAGAKDFIKVCTRSEPKERWPAAKLQQHPWLVSGDSSSSAGGASAKSAATSSSGAAAGGGGGGGRNRQQSASAARDKNKYPLPDSSAAAPGGSPSQASLRGVSSAGSTSSRLSARRRSSQGTAAGGGGGTRGLLPSAGGRRRSKGLNAEVLAKAQVMEQDRRGSNSNSSNANHHSGKGGADSASAGVSSSNPSSGGRKEGKASSPSSPHPPSRGSPSSPRHPRQSSAAPRARVTGASSPSNSNNTSNNNSSGLPRTRSAKLPHTGGGSSHSINGGPATARGGSANRANKGSGSPRAPSRERSTPGGRGGARRKITSAHK